MKYFLIVGEASGDMHAASLIRALKASDKQAEFVGMGGGKMQYAGCRLVRNYKDMAFMGFVAVLKNLNKVWQNFRIARQSLLKEKPDVLILIDYPSFNLRMAQFCKKHLPDTKVVYYIPPKVWAWKRHRIHKIARLSDAVLGIFPFEQDFYAQYGYKCVYVGNPTVNTINQWQTDRLIDLPYQLAKEVEIIPKERVIAVLPGSRRSEILHCLPTMLAAAHNVQKRFPDFKVEVAMAPEIEEAFYQPYLQGETLTRDTYYLLSKARVAIVNSGTATLETALLGCPQVAVYHIAFSRFFGKHVVDFFKHFLFHDNYFTLVNILSDKETIKELIAEKFTVENITEEVVRLLTDEDYEMAMRQQYYEIKRYLGTSRASINAAKIISQLV